RRRAADRRPAVPVSRRSPSLMLRQDPARRDQISDTLLKNAIAYSARGSAIELWPVAEADHAVIRVRDHGPGIGAVDQERIFERFARGAAAADQPGMGIGPYESRAIATGLAGGLFVEP